MTTVCVPSKRPTYSPWGGIQTCRKYAEGIYSVSTAGHGGYMVSLDVARATLSKPAQERGERYNGWLCYEEDDACNILLFERPDLWDEAFKWGRAAVARGADVCSDTWVDSCARPVVGSLDGFGFCALHEDHVRGQRLMVNDPRESLRQSLSSYNSGYLIEMGIEPEPERYARFLKGVERDRLRAARCPDLTVAALGMAGGVVKVWTADDKVHYVTAESYGGGGNKADHRLSNMVLIEYTEGKDR